jgi:hypothetical protein
MLVRLLIAVLMLAGPLPGRVCTCAAAARPSAQADQALPSPWSPAAEAKGCGCRTKSDLSPRPDAAQARCCDHSAGAGHSHPDRVPHDRDCPAVNPAPAVAAAVPSPAAEEPAGGDLGLPCRVEPADGGDGRVVTRFERRPVCRSVPLYISLLTLRN